MNNVFLRDRMERNNSDFEGSGIGEGRFDEYEEEKAKFSDAILPFIILTFMIIGLAGIIYLHITEIRKISGATQDHRRSSFFCKVKNNRHLQDGTSD